MHWKYYFNYKGIFDTPVPSAKLPKTFWVAWERPGIERNREDQHFSAIVPFAEVIFSLILALVLTNTGLVPCRRLQNYFDWRPPRYQRQSSYLRRDDGLGNEEFMSSKRNDKILNSDSVWGKSTTSASATLPAARGVCFENLRKLWKCPFSVPEMLQSVAQQSQKHQNTTTLPRGRGAHR